MAKRKRRLARWEQQAKMTLLDRSVYAFIGVLTGLFISFLISGRIYESGIVLTLFFLIPVTLGAACFVAPERMMSAFESFWESFRR